MGVAMFYYSYFSCRGREILADVLGDDDPFAIPPAELVERILDQGYTPVIDRPKPEPWRTIGTVTEVEREEQTFIVSVSRDAEKISLQEMRIDAYNPVESRLDARSAWNEFPRRRLLNHSPPPRPRCPDTLTCP